MAFLAPLGAAAAGAGTAAAGTATAAAGASAVAAGAAGATASWLTPALIATGIGTGLNVLGTLQEGKMAAAMGEYNAKVAEADAEAAQRSAAWDEKRQRTVIRRTLAEQRAKFGASGVTMKGSPLNLLAETAQEGELDAQAIRYKGQIASGFYKNQASLYRFYGQQKRIGSYYTAGATLLGGANRIYKAKKGLTIKDE